MQHEYVTQSGLNSRHWEEIVVRSGVSEQIARLNFRTIEDSRESDRALNLNVDQRWKHGDHLTPGWMGSGVDPITGEPTLLGVQYKPDVPPLNADGKPIKYLSPVGEPTQPTFLDTGERNYWPQVLALLSTAIFLIEGLKKAGCLLGLGYAGVSVPGVWNAQVKGRLKEAIKQFCAVGRLVYLCFDSDVMAKVQVQQALERLGRLLVAEGCVVKVVLWDPQYKGIDDLYVGAGAKTVHDAIANALTFEEWRDRFKSTQVYDQSAEDPEIDIRAEINSLDEQGALERPPLFSETLMAPLMALSGRTNLPLEAYVACLIPVLASSLGLTTQLEIDPSTDFVVSPIIWLGLVGLSGTRKSPLIKAVTKPLIALQEEAEADLELRIQDYEVQLKRYDCLSKAAKVDEPKPTPPAAREYYLDDYTMEALSQVLGQQKDKALLVLIEELARFFNSMDVYRSKGGDRQHWLSFYDGAPLKVNRKSTGRLYVPRTGISILGGVQPSVIETLMLKDESVHDGLWPRFAWVHIPLAIAPGIGGAPPSQLSGLLRRLYSRLQGLVPQTYRLSEAAKTAWNAWHLEMEQAIMREPSDTLRAVYPKARERAARIALVVHCTNAVLMEPSGRPAPEISEQTLMDAIAFSRWLIGQTKLLYCAIEPSSDPMVARVLKFKERFADQGWITARIARKWWSGKDKPPATEIRKFMAQVVSLGYAIDNGESSDSHKYQVKIVNRLERI